MSEFLGNNLRIGLIFLLDLDIFTIPLTVSRILAANTFDISAFIGKVYQLVVRCHI